MIHVFTSSRYKVPRKDIVSQAEEYLQKRHYQRQGNINIVFVGKRRMRQTARDYLNKDIAKPVLSFKFGDEGETFGEVFLCYPQVVLLAAEKNKSVDDMIHQLVEHGLDNLYTL